MLTNPRRGTYRGWDDAGNRNRLLDAAKALRPSWVMSLDADELIAADDALALRHFLGEGAHPDHAYLFRVYRMIGDGGHYDSAGLWVGRLFSPRPEHVFPSDRLHFVPLPTAIPRELWRRTTIRIQHRAGLTADHRRARFQKYEEADPQREWQRSYEHLLAEPGRVHQWFPRNTQLSVLANEPAVDATPLASGEPAMSVIVIAQNNEDTIERSVEAIVRQECDEPFEVIVVTSGTDRTASLVRERFPDVCVIELDRPVLPGAARNVGLRVAQGRYASFPGSHIELAPGSVAARLAAHRQGWAMVTGTTLNGTPTCAGWASYFLDNANLLPGRPPFIFEHAPPRCSYRRDALVDVGGFPEGMRAGEDTVVNNELFARGFSAYRDPAVRAVHVSRCRTTHRLIAHHFGRGRGMGRILMNDDRHHGRARLRYVAGHLVRALPGRLMTMHRRVQTWGGALKPVYRKTLPLIVLGAISYWLGTCVEVARLATAKNRDATAR